MGDPVPDATLAPKFCVDFPANTPISLAGQPLRVACMAGYRAKKPYVYFYGGPRSPPVTRTLVGG